VAQAHERSRDGSQPNRHPQTRRTYLLRSHVICYLCDRRLAGKTRKNNAHVYYCCRPTLNHAGRPDRLDGHPANVYIREDLLAEAVHAFFAERIFGPDRQALLADDLCAEQPRTDRDAQAARSALNRALADNAKRQDRLVRCLEERDDPTGALADRVNNRLAELEAERRQAIENSTRSTPPPPPRQTRTATCSTCCPSSPRGLPRSPSSCSDSSTTSST
jgi:site-specific DNA recombinase